jgi:hypothetical protein
MSLHSDYCPHRSSISPSYCNGVCKHWLEVLSGLFPIIYIAPYTDAPQIFIIISGIGAVVFYFVLPETKGIPLEEMAKLFGDTDDIMVYAEDIHIDHNTHELVVEEHGKENGLTHVATEVNRKEVTEKGNAAEMIDHQA